MADELQDLERLVQSLREDFDKAERGNRAAGTRFRKGTVQASKLCKSLRQYSLEAHVS